VRGSFGQVNDEGVPAAEILEELDGRRGRDPDVHGARLFGLVYPSGRPDLEELLVEVNRRYLFHNALNPFKFKELAALETDVVASVAALVNRRATGTAAGVMTSGGTESILMAMLVARGRARARGIERPVILAPRSAHPAYAKAAHYFGMELAHIPLGPDWAADATAAADLAGESTAVVVASAFSYPYGIMDPVTDLAEIAASVGAGCHVDACIGGFVLPFLERVGRAVPPWDFRVPGVTSISVDVHKYGYVPKGASVVLHRDDDWFGHQAFLYDGWGAGLYGSGAMAGARPGAPVACAWAAIRHLGVAGYCAITNGLMGTVAEVRDVVAALDGVDLVGDPIGPVLALQSAEIDLYAVGDVMDGRGWHLNRNTEPRGLHLMLSPAHGGVATELLADLADAVAHHGVARQGQARYS
jgi:glutamate/tyrosine decarboxylase-like PLP-dependent enzyme